MDREELKKRLMATFLDEVAEHVSVMNRELLVLERASASGARAESLRSIFRTVHSLKSASRSVQLQVIESLCHHLEELLLPVRDGRGELGAELTSILFLAADAFEDASRRLRGGEPLTGSPAAALLDRVSSLKARPLRAASVPSSAPAGPRIVMTPGPVAVPGEPASPAPRTGPEVSGEASARVTAGGLVRIAPDKLDLLLARGGELRVARRRTHARSAELDALRALLDGWDDEWRRLVDGPVHRALGEGGDASDRRALPLGALRVVGRTGERLRRLQRELDRLAGGMTSDARAMDRVAVPLEHELQRVRMSPFIEGCEGLERHARDVARAVGKEVEVLVDGRHVEIDRAVLQVLRDPLLHLVRNAVDHGLEAPSDRRLAGKPAEGRIVIHAALRGDTVEITVADDGRGLDLAAIRTQCDRRHLPVPENPRELARAIFLPGFSTARLLTHVSGRGVGLDVVKTQIESIHGAVDVEFDPGRGTRFRLLSPLTLSSIRVLMVRVNERVVAVPETNVLRVVRAGPADLSSVEGRDVLLTAEGPVPAVALAHAMGRRGGSSAPFSTVSSGKIPMVLLASGGDRLAAAVDDFLEAQDVIVKPLGRRLRSVKTLSGATILPSGQVALVLSVAAVVRNALERGESSSVRDAFARAPTAAPKRIIVADDSVTTRTLEKSILEASGYDVLSAPDGQAAWDMLQEHGADLVVSDVEMPRMDGFQLTEAIRSSRRFRELPVVLVTALESEHDRARGLEVGADAYLPKSAFDQRALLDAIRQLA